MRSDRSIFIYLVLAAIEALFCAVFSLSIPGGASNGVLWGLSAARLVLLGFFLAGFVLSLYLMVSMWRQKQAPMVFGFLRTKDPLVNDGIFLFCVTLAALSFYALFFPPEQVPRYQMRLLRLRPFFLFAALFFSQSVALLLHLQRRFALKTVRQRVAVGMKRTPFLAALAVMLLVVLWVALTRAGIRPSDFWEKNGVPLLFSQVALSTLLTCWLYLVLRLLHRRYPGSLLGRIFEGERKGDALLFLGLWAISALLWVREPLPYNAFNPGPFPPNDQYYPYSDAAYYYSYTQWARIGQPLQLVDKPLYAAFLFVLRWIAGSEVNPVIALQAGIFAVLPALVYLVTRRIAGRYPALLAALLVVFQVRNSIASSLYLWKVSHPKMLMSEIPLGILLALFSLALVRFLLRPGKNSQYVILSAGLFGLSTLVRHNVWIFFPFLLLLFLLNRSKQAQRGWQNVLLFLLALAVTISPWMWRSQQETNTPFYFLIPFTGTVLENRYLPSLEESRIDLSAAWVETEQDTGGTRLASPAAAPSDRPAQQVSGLIARIQNHFFHNLVAGAFILPVAADARSLEQTVVEHPSATLWDYIWDGRLSPGSRILLYLNLMVLAWGIHSAWKNARAAGLTPLALYLLYSLATAAALTSGGRYIVPMSWVVLIYYAAGVFSLLSWVGRKISFAPPAGQPPGQGQGRRLMQSKGRLGYNLLWLGLFFIIGALPVVFEQIYPPRFADQDPYHVLDILGEKSLFDDVGLDYDTVLSFLKQEENGRLQRGRALYPRFFDFQTDESLELFRYIPKDQPAFTFQFIGPSYALSVLQVDEPPDYFPNESTVIILGCLHEKENVDIYIDQFIEAFAIWLLDEDETILFQPDEGFALSCEGDK